MARSALVELLQLKSDPVAVTFIDTAPSDIPRVSAPEPAGCGYWRRAVAGEEFSPVADEHRRCPIGDHTHNVPLSLTERDDLISLVKTMVGLSYLKMEEVPQTPRRKTPLQTAVYAPLAQAPR